MQNKKDLRKAVLNQRSLLTKNEVEEKSKNIIEKLIRLKEFSSSGIIMCYVDFKNEVVTKEFIAHCLRIGKRVAIPLVTGTTTIIASEIFDIQNDIELGTYGILEPKKDKINEINPQGIDMVIVPGVAFDIHGYRIGYGAGYYDRFLKKVNTHCIKIGIAFESQICNEFLHDEYDIPVDMIITEQNIYGKINRI